MSFPLAYNSNNKRNIMPHICARSRNLSDGLRRGMISHKTNNTCPPSSAGIGNRLKTAKFTAIKGTKINKFNIPRCKK